ncbi:MAG TPA: hypothetical protein VJN02_05835 [Gammaproteobacteria bacterium]|nr:hypothetical protein [Gammaproteobacteria bacterium]
MILRNAIQSDAAQLVALVAQMGSSYKMSLENMQARITAFNNKSHQIVIAEEGGSLVGVIAFACYKQLRIPGSCCHIDTLVIDNNH